MKKNKQTKKQRHLVIHLVTGAINTNSLWQKEKRKRSAQNVYRSFFRHFSSLIEMEFGSGKERLLKWTIYAMNLKIGYM